MTLHATRDIYLLPSALQVHLHTYITSFTYPVTITMSYKRFQCVH